VSGASSRSVARRGGRRHQASWKTIDVAQNAAQTNARRQRRGIARHHRHRHRQRRRSRQNATPISINAAARRPLQTGRLNGANDRETWYRETYLRVTAWLSQTGAHRRRLAYALAVSRRCRQPWPRKRRRRGEKRLGDIKRHRLALINVRCWQSSATAAWRRAAAYIGLANVNDCVARAAIDATAS